VSDFSIIFSKTISGMEYSELVSKCGWIGQYLEEKKRNLLKRIDPKRLEAKMNKLIRNDDLVHLTSDDKSILSQYIHFLEVYEGEKDTWPVSVLWDLDRLKSFILFCDKAGKKGQTMATKINCLKKVKI
jgi:hypothetical protein